jgi:hypothetical protein
VTAMANSADNHDQSIGQGSAHSDTPSRVNLNVGCLVTLEVYLYSCFVSCKPYLIYIRKSVTVLKRTHVHMIFLTQKNLRNKISEG